MKYAFIEAHRDTFRVQTMCRVLGVSRSGYYDWRGRPLSARAREDQRLLRRIRAVHTASRGAYGAHKTWQALRQDGERCGRHRVARLRRVHGIEANRRRRQRRRYAVRQGLPPAPNRVARRFTVPAPNRVWVSDITCIPTRHGWLYLAVMLDLYARTIVGWSMRDRPDQSLTIDALAMAVQRRRPAPGLIVHSDQGAQYRSARFRAALKAGGMVQSMSRKGNCLDNAVAESFFSTLKNELVHDRRFENRDHARAAIFDYIEVFYNRNRLHQTLNYQTPLAFERNADVA